MPQIHFTPHLSRHLDCPTREVNGTTLREALRQVFVDQPELESYILDDQGRVRRHVMIFVDNRMISDRQHLSDPLTGASEVYVMQALSGG